MSKKLRDFVVTLYPAKMERGYFVTRFEFGQDLPRKRVQASSADDVVAEARTFASDHGQPCHAGIRITQGRKPAGFDAKTKALYFNMDMPEAS